MTYGEAFDSVTSFYSDKTKAGQARASEGFKSGQLTAAIAYFPQEVVIALAHLVKYLSTFDVADALLETRFFSKFTERTHMLLNGNTLTHLSVRREIDQAIADASTQGDFPQRDRLYEARVASMDPGPHNDQIRRAHAQGLDRPPAHRQSVRPSPLPFRPPLTPRPAH